MDKFEQILERKGRRPNGDKIRLDVHNYGAIAFYNPWLAAQGYKQENLLKDIVDACFNSNLGISAITSCQFDIPQGSQHDRFGLLLRQAKYLPRGYVPFKISDNILHVSNVEDAVYLINGQAVIINENGKRIHNIVLGSNQVPNNKGLVETLDFCDGLGLPQFAVNPYCAMKFGMGEELFKLYGHRFDAVIAHNSEMVAPDWMSKLPKVGHMASQVSRSMIPIAKTLATSQGVHSISATSAHYIGDFGKGAIEFDRKKIDFTSEESILRGIKQVIASSAYTTIEEYVSWLSVINHMRTKSQATREKWP